MQAECDAALVGKKALKEMQLGSWNGNFIIAQYFIRTIEGQHSIERLLKS